MKRSEIVQIIADNLPDPDDFFGEQEKRERANHILTLLEEAGMIPPDCNHYNDEYGEWRHWEAEEK